MNGDGAAVGDSSDLGRDDVVIDNTSSSCGEPQLFLLRGFSRSLFDLVLLAFALNVSNETLHPILLEDADTQKDCRTIYHQ